EAERRTSPVPGVVQVCNQSPSPLAFDSRIPTAFRTGRTIPGDRPTLALRGGSWTKRVERHPACARLSTLQSLRESTRPGNLDQIFRGRDALPAAADFSSRVRFRFPPASPAHVARAGDTRR